MRNYWFFSVTWDASGAAAGGVGEKLWIPSFSEMFCLMVGSKRKEGRASVYCRAPAVHKQRENEFCSINQRLDNTAGFEELRLMELNKLNSFFVLCKNLRLHLSRRWI